MADLINWMNPVGTVKNVSGVLYDMFNSAQSENTTGKAAKKKKKGVGRSPDNVEVNTEAGSARVTSLGKMLRTPVRIDVHQKPDDRLSEIYKQINLNAENRRGERTKSIRDMMNEQQNILQNSQAQVNLRPTAQFVDAMTGSNFAAGYEAPKQTMKNMARVDALQGAIEGQNEAAYKDKQAALLAEMKSRQAIKNAEQKSLLDWAKLGNLYNKPIKGSTKKEKELKNLSPKELTSFTAKQSFMRNAMKAIDLVKENYKLIGYGKSLEKIGGAEYFDQSLYDAKRGSENLLRRALGKPPLPETMTEEERQYFSKMGIDKIVQRRKRINGQLQMLGITLAKRFEGSKMSDKDREFYLQMTGDVKEDPATVIGKLFDNLDSAMDDWNSDIKIYGPRRKDMGELKGIDKKQFFDKYKDLIVNSDSFKNSGGLRFVSLKNQNKKSQERIDSQKADLAKGTSSNKQPAKSVKRKKRSVPSAKEYRAKKALEALKRARKKG